MILLSLLFYILHPIHVSVTEIEYSEKHKSLQIISRIFIDDLELSIRAKLNDETLDILHPKTGLTTDKLVQDYLQDHFRVRLDGKPVKINFLAHEIEDVAIICYLEIEGIKKLKTIEVTNSVIQETHNDQSNLVHVTYKGPIKSLRLTRENPTGSLDIALKK
ncbi:MAG: hypothetical protein JNK10_05220 [Cyclobacteriaceae bacterium]|nr:hypothetical protein [Cyclobacteriaceae bacterium]